MSTRTSYDHGTPCWVDLMSPDLEASKAFYSALFGWDARDELDDEGNRIYVSFMKDGQAVAGLGEQMPGMPPNMPAVWSSYIAVDDIGAITAKVEAAGGSVMAPEMQIMESGSMAVYTDPTGAVISVWKAGTHLGAELVNEANTYAWNELLNRDLETAKTFYTEVFGWEYDAMEMGPMGTYNVVQGGENGGLAGMMNMPAQFPERVPNHWMVYFMVDDAEAACAKATELGGNVVSPPTATPVGILAAIHDPQIGTFSIMQPAAHQD